MDAIITILEFEKHLKATGYAEGTIENYLRNLNQFSKHLSARKITDLRKVTHRVMADYQEEVSREALAGESKANRLRPVKRLFEYLTETHRLLINPTEEIVETCRKNRKIGTILTVEEIKILLEQPDLTLRTHARDRAIMEVLYSTGIRLDELVNVETDHADLIERVLYVRKGKENRQRVVPLGKNAVKYLKHYLDDIRPWYAKKSPEERALFLNHFGKPMEPESVRQLIRKHRIRAGIVKPVSPHTLRRTCATHFMNQGMDIRYVQKLLGHRHLSTTQLYTKVMPLEIKETHNRTHPGG